MNIFLSYLVVFRSQLINIVRFKQYSKILLIVGFITIIYVFMVFDYYVFKGFFLFITSYEELNTVLSTYAFNSFFLLLFILSFFTNIISFISSHTSKSNTFLFSKPIHPTHIFLHSFLRAYITGLWPIFILAIPTIASYSRVVLVTPWFLYIFIVSMIAISFFSTVFAALVFLMGYQIVRKLSQNILLFLLFLTLSVSAYVLTNIFLPNELWDIYREPFIENVSTRLIHLQSFSPIIPTTLITQALFNNNFEAFLIFCTFAVFLFVLLMRYASTSYGYIWKISQEKYIQFAESGNTTHLIQTLFSKHPLMTVFLKRILAVIRSPSETGYALFILFIGLLITFITARIPHLSTVSSRYVRPLYIFLFLSQSYILAIIAMRFIYPVLSFERFESWFLFTSPITKKRYGLYQLLSSFFLLLCIQLLFYLLPLILLKTPVFISVFYLLSGIGVAATTTAITQSIGNMYPSKNTQNVEHITSTFPAITAILLVLFYISFVTWNFSIIIGDESQTIGFFIFLLIIISTTITTVFSSLSVRALKKVEF